MKRTVFASIVAFALSLIFVVPAFADSNNHVCPSPGPDFGHHISSMAPEHPKEYGEIFGQMVSDMARGTEVH